MKNLPLLWLILELIAFVLVGKIIGFFAAIILIILTTMFGFALLRQKSFEILSQMQMGMRGSKPFVFDARDNALTTIAGILLIIPGFITDFLGICFLIPGIKNRLIKFFESKKIVKVDQTNDNVITGEFWEEK